MGWIDGRDVVCKVEEDFDGGLVGDTKCYVIVSDWVIIFPLLLK